MSIDFRNILRNDKVELERYNHYKALGYNDNQSFVLAVFTYGASRSMNYWMDVERSGLSMAINYYEKNFEDKGIKFCDFFVHLLSKTILQYAEKDRTESLACFLDVVLCNYFGVGMKKAETVASTCIKGFVGNFANSVPPTPTIENCYFEEAEELISNENVTELQSDCCLDNAMFRSSAFCAQSVNSTVEKATKTGLFSKLGAVKQKVMPSMFNMELSSANVLSNERYENIRTDSYETIEEHGFLSPLTSPTSTFRMTCNTASMGILKNNMKNGLYIKNDMVRIEELLNYFKYSLSKPTDRMFNINTEICRKPNSNNKLLFIGVQGKKYIPSKQNIVFLLDVSGSMTGHVDVSQLSFFTVLSKMKDGDILSLITYSNTDETIYDSKVLNKDRDIDEIIKRFLKINIYGCTHGSAGMETAYKIAKRNYLEDGVNRVILVTDGDLNFGLTEKHQLEEFIREKKETGVFLSVIGTGLSNYKDDKLEILAKNGNGNYFVVNDIEDVQENIYNKYASLVFCIAKDVKAQVEFNPKYVKSYRLIGYENRELKHEDFKNDNVISEPFGSGAYAVALYELEMADGNIESELRYQKPIIVDSEELCTVSVRYKEPDSDTSSQLFVTVKNREGSMSNNLKLAYSIFAVGEKLRNSKFTPDIELLKKEFDASSEFFIDMVKLNGKKMSLLYNMIKKLDVLCEHKEDSIPVIPEI